MSERAERELTYLCTVYYRAKCRLIVSRTNDGDVYNTISSTGVFTTTARGETTSQADSSDDRYNPSERVEDEKDEPAGTDDHDVDDAIAAGDETVTDEVDSSTDGPSAAANKARLNLIQLESLHFAVPAASTLDTFIKDERHQVREDLDTGTCVVCKCTFCYGCGVQYVHTKATANNVHGKPGCSLPRGGIQMPPRWRWTSIMHIATRYRGYIAVTPSPTRNTSGVAFITLVVMGTLDIIGCATGVAWSKDMTVVSARESILDLRS